MVAKKRYMTSSVFKIEIVHQTRHLNERTFTINVSSFFI